MLTLERALAALPEARRTRIEENARKTIEGERVLRRLREAPRPPQRSRRLEAM